MFTYNIVLAVMGYMGFFLNVKAKSFEILSKVGNSRVRFAERSRGVY